MTEATLGILLFIVPLTMVGFGRMFLSAPPKKINGNYGFRTSMSIMNMDTWKFAQYHCGKLWTKVGSVSLILAIASYVLMLVCPQELKFNIIGVVMVLELIALIAPTFIVEGKLKHSFDKFGRKI